MVGQLSCPYNPDYPGLAERFREMMLRAFLEIDSAPRPRVNVAGLLKKWHDANLVPREEYETPQNLSFSRMNYRGTRNPVRGRGGRRGRPNYVV